MGNDADKAGRWVLWAALWISAPAWSATPHPPQVGPDGARAYAEYQAASEHKAFVVAPGGVWAWRADLPSASVAEKAALADCAAHTRLRCLTFAVNQSVVLDQFAWRQAWGPYLTAAQVARAPVGMRPGNRFPDLAMSDGKGRARRLSDLRGQVVVVHFWGSWCPHCVREMPDLQRLYDRLRGHGKVAFVLLPVREDIGRARRWIRSQRLGLPLFDGGPTVAGEHAFRLADGGRLADRDVARVFPSTYVLDRHGVVLFSHTGPVANWLEYEPQLTDAAERSGR